MDILDIVISLLTLTVLEVVLGIDNLVFIAIITQRLPREKQKKARSFGLSLALITRLILLASAIWLTKLTTPLFTLFEFSFSGRDIFLIVGGLFLLVKATQEIHSEIEPGDSKLPTSKYASMHMVIIQIAILDIIFSLDSVLTAVGLTQNFWIMATAIFIAIGTMMFASTPLSNFIEKNPTIKMLALSFLILIGMVLIADGFHFHIPRGYIYFSLGFSIFVEALNIVNKKRRKSRLKQKKRDLD